MLEIGLPINLNLFFSYNLHLSLIVMKKQVSKRFNSKTLVVSYTMFLNKGWDIYQILIVQDLYQIFFKIILTSLVCLGLCINTNLTAC